MGILGHLAGHWLDVLQTASILAGFFNAAYTIRTDTRERKITNLFALTGAHRELWSRLYTQPDLTRLLSPSVDLETCPVTLEEELFLHLLILHVRMAFKARDYGMQFDDDAVAADVGQLFSRPIPRVVWQRSKVFQDRAFVAFMDDCLRRKPME